MLMKPVSIVAALAIAVTSAAASFTPTQASALPRAVPAAHSEASPAGVTEVRHKRKIRRHFRHHRRGYSGRRHTAPYDSDARLSVYREGRSRGYRSYRRYRHYDRGYYRYRDHGYYYRDRGYYRDRDDDDVGAAVVAGIIGLTAGAIIAGQAHGGSSYHAVCARKYRSYDPRSGTYLGYDGYRHRCRG